MILYVDRFWISPYAFSAFVALEEKGVVFETREVALDAREQKDPAYVGRSLTGRVPALEDGEFCLAESSAIVEYIDETQSGPSLLPRDLKERARARQVMAWIRSDLDALRAERPTHTMFYERAKTPLSRAGETAADRLVGVAARLVANGRQDSLFSTWSVADADLAFMLHRLILSGHELPTPVRAFADAQWKRPSVRAFVERGRAPYVPY